MNFPEVIHGLLLFWSAKEQKMVTLQEYVDKMPAEQKYIYFAAGDSSRYSRTLMRPTFSPPAFR